MANAANTSFIDFVWAPLTLAAYTIEGRYPKACLDTKKLMMANKSGNNKSLSNFLTKFREMIGLNGYHQFKCGTQVIQVFETWAHQLTPKKFKKYAKPSSQCAIVIMKEKHPTVLMIYFSNDSSSYLKLQKEPVKY